MEEFQRIILVHYHEIGLKGRNRSVFEKRLQKNLEALLGAYPIVTIHRISGRILVFLREGTSLEAANACTDAILGIPGVARVSCGFKCEQDMEVTFISFAPASVGFFPWDAIMRRGISATFSRQGSAGRPGARR